MKIGVPIREWYPSHCIIYESRFFTTLNKHGYELKCCMRGKFVYGLRALISDDIYSKLYQNLQNNENR